MNSPVTVRLSGAASPWRAAVREVAADWVDRVVFALTAALIGVGYSVMLPFAYTQRVSTANWRYLDARYVAFTVAFALAMAWLVTLQVHAVRRVARAARRQGSADSSGPLGVLAALGSVLPSLLCCSPILPTLVGVLGLSATARLSTTVTLQHFFATNENLIMLGALVLLAGAGLRSVRRLTRAACLTAEGCAIPVGDREVPLANSSSDRQAAGPALTGARPQGGEGSTR